MVRCRRCRWSSCGLLSSGLLLPCSALIKLHAAHRSGKLGTRVGRAKEVQLVLSHSGARCAKR